MLSSSTSLLLRAASPARNILLNSSRCLSTQSVPKSASTETKGKKKSKPAEVSTSFVQNIFRGVVEPEEILPFPEVLSQDQHETLSMLVPPTEKFMLEQNDALANDANESIPQEIMNGLGELGGFGLQVPQEYGGLGLCNTQYARLTEIVGATDLGFGIMMGAHQSIGFKGVLIGGDERQKKKYLPMCSSGEHYAAFCLTEPGSGSDASSIKSRAELSEDGKTWILNGSKIWISNGGIADVFTVFAKTPVKDEKTGTTKDKVTAFIVERGFGGVTNGPPEKKMGIKCSNTAEVFFDNVPIPAENVLGGVGNGFKMAMMILNNGRFGMAGALSGTMRTMIKKAVEFATQRNQFGSKIETYGGVQEKIARMSMTHYVTESMAYMVSGVMDKGYQAYQLEAAISKIFASEGAWYVTDETIQILGGMGYMREQGVEKVMRDLRIFRIFEGTNDILRLFVALTGCQYAGGHLKELQRAVQAPISNFGVVLGEVAKRGKSAMGFGAGNVLASQVHGNLLKPSEDLCTAVTLFGAATEKMLIKHGKDVIHQQFILNRVANAAIDIYAMACIISRCSRSLNNGADSAMHEELMTKTFCSEAFDRVKANLAMTSDLGATANFKNMTEISKAVCASGEPVQAHPLGL